MTSPSVYALTSLQEQVRALEQENTHLKDALSRSADEIAKRDRIISDFAERLRRQRESHRW